MTLSFARYCLASAFVMTWPLRPSLIMSVCFWILSLIFWAFGMVVVWAAIIPTAPRSNIHIRTTIPFFINSPFLGRYGAIGLYFTIARKDAGISPIKRKSERRYQQALAFLR